MASKISIERENLHPMHLVFCDHPGGHLGSVGGVFCDVGWGIGLGLGVGRLGRSRLGCFHRYIGEVGRPLEGAQGLE